MKILTLDTENSTFQYGNPFSRRNRCCIIPYFLTDGVALSRIGFLPWEYNEPLSVDYINTLSLLVKDADLIIGFNLKYDLHWLRRYGIIEYGALTTPSGKMDGVLNKTLWCTQVAQFIIRNQQERMPSLNSSCEFWGLPQKLDVVEKEYWDKGIDTPDIPLDILSEYGMKDVELTYQLYEKQMEYLKDKPELLRLIQLANQDLLVLAEMEWNGLRYDIDESATRAELMEGELAQIDKNLKGIVGDYNFNFNSGDQLSAILYGGSIKFRVSTPYKHTFKSGQKAGQTVERFTHEDTEVKFPRIVEPMDKFKLDKDGYWSTGEPALKQLKATGKAKEIVRLLLERAKLEQLVKMYYRGWPKKMVEMDWEAGEVHSQLNQCVVVTGRLSSSGPNQQNVPPEVYELVKTRYLI